MNKKQREKFLQVSESRSLILKYVYNIRPVRNEGIVLLNVKIMLSKQEERERRRKREREILILVPHATFCSEVRWDSGSLSVWPSRPGGEAFIGIL